MNYLFILLSILTLSTNTVAQTKTKKYKEDENKINWPVEFNPIKSNFYVQNEININADPKKVWKLLIEAKQWNQWYSGIQKIKFQDSTQKNLGLNVLVYWESMGQKLNNTIVEYQPFERLSWSFKEKNLQGCHAWIIIPTSFGCRVITAESQTGKLAKLQRIFLPNKLLKQHDQWLKKLKIEAEK